MNNISLKRKTIIVAIYTLFLTGIHYYFNKTLLPNNEFTTLIYTNTLLVIFLGSAILEGKFTKPTDSFVNSIIGFLLIVNMDISILYIKTCLLILCLIVFTTSFFCIIFSTKSPENSNSRFIYTLYKHATVLGKAKLIYSLIFLVNITEYYNMKPDESFALLLLWGSFMLIWQLGYPQAKWQINKKCNVEDLGNVIRYESPNLIRLAIRPEIDWHSKSYYLFASENNRQNAVIPLYSQRKDEYQLCTGIIIPELIIHYQKLTTGHVYLDHDNIISPESIVRYIGQASSDLIGLIIENSNIRTLFFETWKPDECYEGMLVWCHVGSKLVYYQIINGHTKEEQIDRDIHGFQVATINQLGEAKAKKGFMKYAWLPTMNTPIFKYNPTNNELPLLLKSTDFVYGNIPMTNVKIGGDFINNYKYHTAILGITGSGKTELTFDIIKHLSTNKIHTICIDITSQYSSRLSHLSYTNLDIDKQLADDLENKLFMVETLGFKADKEKQDLKKFSDSLRTKIHAIIHDFLNSKESFLGMISLNEISNTKATILITEMYLSCILKYCKENSDADVQIIVEEAHTVIPETNSSGLADFDSKALVNRISQIALQGRKYGVGLLIISQRTANVSKSVLTQCNTIISFTTYDETSINFLSNFYGAEYSNSLPNLKPLQAIGFGKAFNSNRPILFEIPFNPDKA